MTQTKTSPLSDLLSPVPADWGFYDVARLATPTEITAVDTRCVECSTLLVSKFRAVSGRMIGRRADRHDEFVWSGPFCRCCDTAHCIADGYGE